MTTNRTDDFFLDNFSKDDSVLIQGSYVHLC